AVWRWWNGVTVKDSGGRSTHTPGIAVVHAKHQQWWRERLLATSSKGRRYLSYKKEWGAESYLNNEGSRKGRMWKAQLRACAAPLIMMAELAIEHRGGAGSACCVCDRNEPMWIGCICWCGVRHVMHTMMQDDAS